jgi:hypothetical protein
MRLGLHSRDCPASLPPATFSDLSSTKRAAIYLPVAPASHRSVREYSALATYITRAA